MKEQKSLKNLSIKKETICKLGQNMLRGGKNEIEDDTGGVPTNTTSNNCQGVSVRGCCLD